MINTAHPSRFAPSETLARIAMMEDAQAFMAQNHHGDPERQRAAEGLQSDWLAFVAELRENGVKEPLKVTKAPAGSEVDFIIADGRHRHAGAGEAELEEIPYIVVPDDEAEGLMQGTIKARRNYTKSQKAFIAVLFNEALLTAGPGRPEKSRTECGIKDVAASWGVGARTLVQAIELHRNIKGKARLAKQVEMQVWSGFGLGGILSGLGGKKATSGKSRRPSNFVTVSKTLKSFASQVAEFDTWARDDRVQFADDLSAMVSASPDSVKELLQAVVNEDESAVEALLKEVAK